MTDKIAVIIPFYQQAPGILRRAIESVCAQTDVSNVEVIVVDDGSPVRAHDEMRYEFARKLYYHVIRETRKRDYALATTLFISIIRILDLSGTVEWIKFKLGLPSKIQ